MLPRQTYPRFGIFLKKAKLNQQIVSTQGTADDASQSQLVHAPLWEVDLSSL